MCDYSLHSVATRPAKAGDKLVTASFATTYTRGFAAVGQPGLAVCLRPGTELAFENDIEKDWSPFSFFRRKQPSGKLVRFRQINMERADTHHDAIEFPNGRIVLLTDLRFGQKASVVQLPVTHDRKERLAEPKASGTVDNPMPKLAEVSDR